MEAKLACKKPPLWALILLISFPSVASVLLSAALPQITQFYHVTASMAQQVMTLFVLGYAFGQLCYSPLANRLGRKAAAYAGFAIYFVSCILCLVSLYTDVFSLLLIGRVLMALGSGVGMNITYTIVNDYYEPEASRPIIGYIVLSYAFMPALGVALGGILTTHINWSACLYAFVIYGIVICWSTAYLPETLQKKDLNAFSLKPLVMGYYKAFTHGRLLLFAFIFGLMASYIYVISSEGPYIGIDKIKLDASVYGLLLIIPYCGQFFGAFFAGKLNTTKSVYFVIVLGMLITGIGTVAMFVAFIFGWVNATSLMVPMAFMMMGLPMVYSNASVLAQMKFTDKASGSAMMSFIIMFITFLVVMIMTLLPTNDVITMPAVLLAVFILAVIFTWIGYLLYGNR